MASPTVPLYMLRTYLKNPDLCREGSQALRDVLADLEVLESTGARFTGTADEIGTNDQYIWTLRGLANFRRQGGPMGPGERADEANARTAAIVAGLYTP